MSVQKTEDGTWMVQIREKQWDGSSKHRKKRGFRTKKEALEWESAQTKKYHSKADIPMKEFVEVYYEDKKNVIKYRTMVMKKQVLNLHVLPYFGDKTMGEITPEDIIKWQNLMSEKEYSQSYLRIVNNQLVALYTHACRIYDLPNNPCKKVPKMGKDSRKELNYWTVDEYQEFINHLKPGSRPYMIFETLFWTGMRIGELLALKKKDIYLDRDQIRIDKTFYRRNGVELVTSPKTEESNRTVDIPRFLTEELAAYMQKIYGLEDNDRIFEVTTDAVRLRLHYYIDTYGLKPIRVHDFRHSHCAYLIHQGVDPMIIKERLGHKDIKITLNTYGHLYPSRQRSIADMLDRKKKEGFK